MTTTRETPCEHCPFRRRLGAAEMGQVLERPEPGVEPEVLCHEAVECGEQGECRGYRLNLERLRGSP